MPVFNNLQRTLRFLESFAAMEYQDYQIVLVDDGSTDGTTEQVTLNHPSAVVLQGTGDLWWSGATNLGVQYALDNDFDYVLTINNDTIVESDLLDRLLATAAGNPFSIVGSLVQYLGEPEKVWGAGTSMLWRERRVWELNDHDAKVADVLARRPDPFLVDALPGCGTLVPCDCYRAAGLYDARWLPQYHGDSEFTVRAARQGYRCLVSLGAVVYNDAENTGRVHNFFQYVFSRRSGYYWPAVVTFLWRHCPPWLIPSYLVRLYGGYWLNRRGRRSPSRRGEVHQSLQPA